MPNYLEFAFNSPFIKYNKRNSFSAHNNESDRNMPNRKLLS